MSSGCACIVSKAVGASHFLIHDGENGLLFKNKNRKSFQLQLKKVLDDSLLREKLSFNAYHTMLNEWRPEVAGERLVNLIKNLLHGIDTDYQTGPCSKAYPIK